MGYDLSGRMATSKHGEYFRNNVWWWRRLWAFVCWECLDDMSKKNMESGHWNNGDLIPAKVALKIADRLDLALKEGRVQRYSRQVSRDMKKAEKLNQGKKFGDAGFDFDVNYPFDTGNVRSFAKFARESGGF